MNRLKKALEQHASALGIPRALYQPRVTQSVLIHHKAELSAKVGGREGRVTIKGGWRRTRRTRSACWRSGKLLIMTIMKE